MVVCTRQIAFRSFPLLALALLGLAAPRALSGQQGAQVTDDRLATYAKVFVETGKARDQIHAELAKVRNKTTEAQTELRRQMREKIAEILQQNGMTEEEYQRITHVVSVDQDRREKFDELVTAAANAPSGEAPSGT